MSMLTAAEVMRRIAWIGSLAAALAVLALLLPLTTQHLSEHTDLHPALVWFTRGLGVLAIVISAFMLTRRYRPITAIGLLGFSTLLIWQMLFACVGNLANNLFA